MKKGINCVLGVLLFVNLTVLVSAVDVVYVVLTPDYAEQEFIEVLNELSLSYDLVRANQINNYDFSSAEMLLVNNDFFSNWQNIPVNEMPAVIVNGRHMDEWGWTRKISLASQNVPLHIALNNSHPIAEGLGANIQVYTNNEPDLYHLDRTDIFNGLEIVGSNTFDSGDGVVVAAEAGSVLTRPGYPNTNVNANSVFFGIDNTDFWTGDTRHLFINSIEWAMGEPQGSFEINLRTGQNLVSIPLLLSTNDVNEILISNPEVVSVKKYTGNSLVETSTIENNNGYFMESTSNSVLTVEGEIPLSTINVQLSQGMNLVGITSLSSIDLDSLPGQVIEVSRRNLDGSYSVATKYLFGWYNEFPLEPGRGYWFKTSQGVTWSYEPV